MFRHRTSQRQNIHFQQFFFLNSFLLYMSPVWIFPDPICVKYPASSARNQICLFRSLLGPANKWKKSDGSRGPTSCHMRTQRSSVNEFESPNELYGVPLFHFGPPLPLFSLLLRTLRRYKLLLTLWARTSGGQGGIWVQHGPDDGTLKNSRTSTSGGFSLHSGRGKIAQNYIIYILFHTETPTHMKKEERCCIRIEEDFQMRIPFVISSSFRLQKKKKKVGVVLIGHYRQYKLSCGPHMIKTYRWSRPPSGRFLFSCWGRGGEKWVFLLCRT